MKKIPGTLTIVCYIIVLAAVLTWFVPGGEYARETRLVNGVEREMVVGQSFHYVDKQPQTFSVFFALFKGFVENAGIIVFVLIVGGAFWILNSTRAIDTGVKSFVAFTRRCRQKKWLSKIDVDSLVLAVIMLMFSLFGSVFGMSEETIAFIVIFVPMAVSMGYDSITGVCISYLAAHVGFAGATLNPFTIGIAQGIAGIPLYSGLEYRVLCWFVLTSLAIVFVLWYARRIKKNPEKSPVYRIDQKTGLLTRLLCLPVSGEYPKDVALFPDNRHLVSLNQDSGTLTFFNVDLEKGLLESFSETGIHICDHNGDHQCGGQYDSEIPADLFNGESLFKFFMKDQIVGIKVYAEQDHGNGYHYLQIYGVAGHTVVFDPKASGSRRTEGDRQGIKQGHTSRQKKEDLNDGHSQIDQI